MKMLILGLLITTVILADTQNSEPEILNPSELSNKFVSVIQGAKLEDQLVESGEFKSCADQAKFDPKKLRAEQTLDSTAAQSLADCFSKKIGDRKPEDIQKLSETLNLQGYQLIRGKTVRDITSYLTNQVYKRMTGIDLDDQNMQRKIEAMKFKNQKIVDQKDFVELYRIQVGKSALYEISRFCFVNLRNTEFSGASNFIDHWTKTGFASPGKYLESLITRDAKGNVLNISSFLNDSGSPTFGASINEKDKTKLYTSIKDSLKSSNSPDLDPNAFKGFFENCMLTIAKLCEDYKKNSSPSGVIQGRSLTSSASGGNACITQARLQNIRRGMANTTLVINQFKDDLSGGTAIQQDGNQVFKKYNSGDATDGLNAISTITSNDILEGSKNENNELAADCASGKSSGDDCKGFLINDDSFKQALHDTDVNLRLKTELEVKNLSQLLGSQGLDDYLDKMGYFELKKIAHQPGMDAKQFSDAVRSMFDARRLAALQAIHDKMANRQVDKTTTGTDGPKAEDAITKSAEEEASERGRLAQVVLFTNIVTSQLELKRKESDGSTKSLGANDFALTQEKNGLDSNFFANNRVNASTSGKDTNAADTSSNFLQDISFLDQVIGKETP